MEAVRTQLRRPLPDLVIIHGSYTLHGSTYEKRISKQFLHHWSTFLDEVRATVEGNPQELNMRVPIEDTSPEATIVRNETGVQGRFMQHVGNCMGKIFRRSSQNILQRLRFHDAQVNEEVRTQDDINLASGKKKKKKLPDIIISAIAPNDTTEARIVGELKTAWTVPLAHVCVSSRKNLSLLEPHLGQLTTYMRFLGLRYGFLSTYSLTIFVRRTDLLAFEISEPIPHNAKNPSLRECFYHLGILATSPDYTFLDDLGDAPELQVPHRSFASETSPRNPPSDEQAGASGEAPSISRGGAAGAAHADAAGGRTAVVDDKDALRNGSYPHMGSVIGQVRPDSGVAHGRRERLRVVAGLEDAANGFGRQDGAAVRPALCTHSPRVPVIPASPTPTKSISAESVTRRTTFFGEDSSSTGRVELTKLLRESDSGKMVHEATMDGQEVILKYWPNHLEHSFFGYENELHVYRYILPPSEFIPKFLGAGQVILSNELGDGRVIVLQKEVGTAFSQKAWLVMSEDEKAEFKCKLRSAFEFLRAHGVVQGDTRKDNVLWDSERRRLVLLDLETIHENEDDDSIDGMEYDCILDMELP